MMSGGDRKHGVRSAVLGALILSFAVSLLGLAACAKKILRVDSTFTIPEGTPSADAQMVIWFEAQGETLTFKDGTPIGPNSDDCGTITPGETDTLMSTGTFRDHARGTLRMLIFDGTPTSAYQLLRREEGGGFRPLLDYNLLPARKWLPTGWEFYSFTDASRAGYQPPSYIGRGLVSGTISQSSPLTNIGIPLETSLQDSVADIRYLSPCSAPDSLIFMSWTSVPGAVRYWIQVYKVAHSPETIGLMLSSLPAPINEAGTFDHFVGTVEAPSTSYRLGDLSRSDVKILVYRPASASVPLFVRISAVNASGQMIACTRGGYARIGGEGSYKLYRAGAYPVTPQRRSAMAPGLN